MYNCGPANGMKGYSVNCNQQGYSKETKAKHNAQASQAVRGQG